MLTELSRRHFKTKRSAPALKLIIQGLFAVIGKQYTSSLCTLYCMLNDLLTQKNAFNLSVVSNVSKAFFHKFRNVESHMQIVDLFWYAFSHMKVQICDISRENNCNHDSTKLGYAPIWETNLFVNQSENLNLSATDKTQLHLLLSSTCEAHL